MKPEHCQDHEKLSTCIVGWKVFIPCSAGVIGLILLLAGYVIANDQVRFKEDQRLEDKWGTKLDSIQKDVSKTNVSIARIEECLFGQRR